MSLRENVYFVPRDGISREVITADICRYLGSDAVVWPGTYQDPTTGQSIQGYHITAYRNLTSAMIQDLKNDSALWERERRSRAHMQGLPEGFDSNTLYPGAAHAPGYNDYSTAGPVHQSYSYHEPASHDPGAGVPAANASTSHVAEPMEQYDTYNRKLSVVAATTRYLQTRERRYLPMVLNGRAIYALPDTGVESNVLEEQYAISTGAIIDRSARRVFKNARSRTFSSVGTAVLELSFHSYPEDRWTCSFDVVKNLAVPVVLGARLLEQTRVLKEYAHLFTKKALYLMLNLGNPNKKIWRFMWMQSPRKQLPCLLGERPAVVDLDTGSDIDVVSLEWAEFRRWRIMPVPEDEDTVMVANGELHRLQGFVDVVLSMGPGFAGVEKRLYVMDGLSSDAVLGDPTIESLDLFGKFGGLLIDLHLPEESDAFNNIVWIKKAGKVGEIDQTVERLLAADAAGAPGPSSDNTKKKKSRLGRRSTTLDNDALIEELRQQLYYADVELAQWTQHWESLTPAERDIQQDDYDKAKQYLGQVRQKIRHEIHNRRHSA